MTDTEDVIETTLATALCADAPPTNDNHRGSAGGVGMVAPRWLDGGMASMNCELATRKPEAAFALCESLDANRLLTKSSALLLQHPADIIGNGCEAMLVQPGVAYWRALRPARRTPKGLATIGRAHYWAEMHMRTINSDGSQTYFSTMVPFAKNGTPLAAQWRGAWVCKPDVVGSDAIVTCSIVEDALRPNAILASVRDGVELTFPVGEDAYQEAFAMRDGPALPSGRRRALLHWVAKHMRRVRRGGTSEVRRHMRGAAEFDLGGYRVKLWSTDSSAPSRAAWPTQHNVRVQPRSAAQEKDR